MMRVLMLVVTMLTLLIPGRLQSSPTSRGDIQQYERSILNLSVTRAVPDPESPWAIQNTDVSGHAGVVVGSNLVLAQAAIVSRAVYIQAQKVDDVAKIPMRVLFADYEANLALLEPLPGFSLAGTKILPLGPDIPVGSPVTFVSIENERKLQQVAMRILDIGVREVTVGGMTAPVYSLGGQPRTHCKSDLVLRKGSLVGVCIGVIENEPQVLTAGFLSHFLHDKANPKEYRGYGSFGAALLPVNSPWHRQVLGIESGKGALRVATVYETSSFSDCLAIDDVIMGVDNLAVDHRGFYPHAQWGSVPLRHYIVSKYAGDAISIKFKRKSETKTCTRQLRRYSSQDNVVPGPVGEGPEEHMIFGGLLFRELDADFLSGFGRDWQKSAPAALSFIYTYQNQPTLTRRREIVLSNVLGDTFNAGYEKLLNLVLESVNGRKVTSLAELRVHLKMPGTFREGLEYAQFDFKDGTQVVLPYESLDDAHRRISKTYSVTDPSSFFKR